MRARAEGLQLMRISFRGARDSSITHWFAAVLVIRSSVGAGWDDDLSWTARYVFSEAPTAEDAYQRAWSLGKAEEHG